MVLRPYLELCDLHRNANEASQYRAFIDLRITQSYFQEYHQPIFLTHMTTSLMMEAAVMMFMILLVRMEPTLIKIMRTLIFYDKVTLTSMISSLMMETTNME